MPRLVAGLALLISFHFDQDVAGIEHFLGNNSLPAANFHDFLGRNQHVMNLTVESERSNTTLQALGYFLLKSRVCVDDVPKFH